MAARRREPKPENQVVSAVASQNALRVRASNVNVEFDVVTLRKLLHQIGLFVVTREDLEELAEAQEPVDDFVGSYEVGLR